MAENSSRSDQLWYFALQLAEEEKKSIPFAQQADHGRLIKKKYNQLASNLSCLGDIIAAMYGKEKLTLKELECIQHLQSTPIRANEELLNIIARKPRDAFECFLSLIKDTNQLHLYQMLVSDDDTCDKAKTEYYSDHEDLIRRNFIELSEKLNADLGLISVLYQQNVLTVREKDRILSGTDSIRKSELLLGLLSKKSPEDFEKFLKALEDSGQGHLARKLRKPETGCRSKPVPPPKPGVQQGSIQRHTKSMHTPTVDKNCKRSREFSKGITFQRKLNILQFRLKSDIAIKVTYRSLVYLDRTDDGLKMYFHTLLQESHEMRKEIVRRNVETNVEMEQMRKSANQLSAAAALNDVIRTQLNSVQHELASERFLSNRNHAQLEEEISKLQTDIHNEKVKCKRFEEEKKALTIELEDRLEKGECDKLYCQQPNSEQNARLQTNEERNIELISLRAESEALGKTCEILRKENEKRNDIEEQLLKTKQDNRDLTAQLREKDVNLKMAEEELIKFERIVLENKYLENDRIVKLQEGLDSEKHKRYKLENELINSTAQLAELSLKLEGKDTAYISQDDLPEKYKSGPVSISTMRMTSSEDGKRSINGIAILNKELYIVSENRSEVDVYDSIKSSSNRRWKLKAIINPKDIVSCNRNKCLYVINSKGSGQSNEILRVNRNGNLIKIWSTGTDWGDSLSITSESNVMLTLFYRNKLIEYSPDGQKIREVNLSDAGIHYPSHATTLANGLIVVCHGYLDRHRVCLVDTDGKLLKSFGGKPGSGIGQMNCPVYLSVDGNGFVLVADRGNSRVLLLDSNLELKGEILSEEKHGLRYPRNILLDESTNRVLVVETDWNVPRLIKKFQF